MDIVPSSDDMILEARGPPQYIDRVHAGLPADVHFDVYMSRIERPVVRGKVAVVSADSLADAKTGSALDFSTAATNSGISCSMMWALPL